MAPVGVTLDELANGDAAGDHPRGRAAGQLRARPRRPRSPLDAIRTVAAHPQAARQCRGWLREPPARRRPWWRCSPTAPPRPPPAAGEYDAAICAPIGAERGTAGRAGPRDRRPQGRDDPVRAGGPARPAARRPTGDDITSLAVYIAHDRVGALLAVLTELAVRGVNLTRIESRPTGERLGRYAFFLDCTGHVAEARHGRGAAGAAPGLRRRPLPRLVPAGGQSRRRAPAASPQAPPGTSDADFADSAAWLARLRAGDLA